MLDLLTLEETAAHFQLPDELRMDLLQTPEPDLARLLWRRLTPEPKLTEDLLCLESRDALTDIAVANLAIATGADLRMIHVPADITEKIQAQDEFLRSSSRGASAGGSIAEILLAYHRDLNLEAYRTVTFVTKATPHGLAAPERLVTAHLPHLVDLSRVLPDIMLTELREETRTYTALVFDPGFFPDSETEPISRLLRSAKWNVRRLEGAAASYDAFHAHIQFTPYDLLLIVAHGGTASGQYQVWMVRDAEGHQHIFECEVVLSAGGVRPDGKVHAGFLIVPVRVDGIFWSDSEGKKAIDAGRIVERFLDLHGTGHSPDLDLRGAYELPHVAYSNAVMLHNGALHFLGVHSLGFRENPVVFNNSCSSWADLGARVFQGGARAYVCTARPVDDRDATEVAIRFVELALQGKPLAQALKEATADLPRERNPYMYMGLPFSTMKAAPPAVDAANIWRRRAAELRAQMLRRIEEVDDVDLRRSLQEGVNFIDALLRDHNGPSA